MTMSAVARARLRLLLLAAFFAAPVILSYALFYSGWRPSETRTHGDLITPARPVTDVELQSLDGVTMRLTTTSPPRWSLVYASSSDCASACERALYVMRQVIAAQGREAHRVRPVMIVTDKRAVDKLRLQLKDYPTVVPLTGTEAQISRLARDFQIPDGGNLTGQARLYILDPLGNVVISYSPQTDPSGINKDLKRLLRYSQIG